MLPTQALLLSHPRKFIRDTARFPPLMRATAPGRRPKPRALRHLAAQHLGLTIQAGEHSPVDDARTALYLYLRFQKVRPPFVGVSDFPSIKRLCATTAQRSLWSVGAKETLSAASSTTGFSIQPAQHLVKQQG